MEQSNKIQSLEEARERAVYGRDESEAARETVQEALALARPADQAEAELAKLKIRLAPSGTSIVRQRRRWTASNAIFAGGNFASSASAKNA